MPDNCNVQIDPAGETIDLEHQQREREANLKAINVDNMGYATALGLDIATLPKICGKDFIVINTTAPSLAPDFIGQIYIDTTNSKVYIATGVSSSSSYKVLN